MIGNGTSGIGSNFDDDPFPPTNGGRGADDDIVTLRTAEYEGRRYRQQANGLWLSAEGCRLHLDKTTGLHVFDKRGHLVPPLDAELDLQPVNFGALRLRAEDLKPRGWLLGNWICRQFVSSLVGDGAVGKTTLRLTCALAQGTGRSDLFGERLLDDKPVPNLYVFERVPVLFLCFEDSTEEIYKRLKGVMLHHGIGDADIDGWLWTEAITDARMKLVLEDEFRQRRIGPLKGAIERAIERVKGPNGEKLGTIYLDPLIKTHSVPENDNTAMDLVMQILTGLTIDSDIAVDVPQHVNKTSMVPGDANKGRGASAIKDAGRLYYTITEMSPDEADAYGISEDDRIDYARIDSGKVNPTRKNRNPFWVRRVGVPLGNTWDARYPNGDTLVAIEAWTPTDPLDGVTIEIKQKIFAAWRNGPQPGENYSAAPRSPDWAGFVIMRIAGKTKAQAETILKTWDVLVDAPNARRGSKKARGVMVDETKAEAILGSFYEPPATSPTEVEAENKPAAALKLQPTHRLALKALLDSKNELTPEQWQKRTMAGGVVMTAKAFHAAVQWLVAHELVMVSDDGEKVSATAAAHNLCV